MLLSEDTEIKMADKALKAFCTIALIYNTSEQEHPIN